MEYIERQPVRFLALSSDAKRWWKGSRPGGLTELAQVAGLGWGGENLDAPLFSGPRALSAHGACRPRPCGPPLKYAARR